MHYANYERFLVYINKKHKEALLYEKTRKPAKNKGKNGMITLEKLRERLSTVFRTAETQVE